MKTKRFLALVVSLAMVLSIVPAFSLTVSASVTTNGMLPVGAVKVFDGSLGGKSVIAEPSGDTYVQNVYGDTWSSNWTGGGEGSNAINVIANNDRGQKQNAIQTYDKAGISSYVKTTAGYGSDSDWFAFEYISTAGDVSKDIALLGYNPSTGTEVVIDQFRSGNGGEAVGFFPAGSSRYTTVGTLSESANISNTGYVDWGVYRIFVEKGEGTYTVSYYHSSFANRDVSFTYLGTKTYTGDITGVGFGGLQIYNITSGAWWNNMRFWEPVVWADGVAEGNEAVAVDMASFTQSGSTIVSGTISVAGVGNYLERVDGTTYGGGTPGQLGSARYAQLKFDVPNLDIQKVTLKTKVVRVHNYLGTAQWMRLGVYSGAVTPSGTNTSYKLSEEKVYGAGNANTVYNDYLHTDVTDYITAGAENTLTLSVPYSAFSIESTPQLIVEYTPAATQKTIVATYTAGGKTVNTVEKLIDTSETTEASFDEYFYVEDGSSVMYHAPAQSLPDSATIVMEALENHSDYQVGLEFALNGVPYTVKSTNLIPNGNFEHGLRSWFDGAGAAASAFTVNGDGTVTSTSHAGNGGAGCLYRSWPVESGKTYVFTAYHSAENAYQILSFSNDLGTNEAVNIYGNGDNVGSLYGNFATGTTYNVFTNTDGYNYVKIRYRWNGTNTFGNFGLYEVEVDESRIANTTIKFEDANGTTLKDSVTITGVLGDVIDLTDTSIVPSTITYNGNLYAKAEGSATSHTVTTTADTVTVTYETDAYTSFTGAAVTVIAGNDPVLSTTVTAVTGKGATTVVDGAVWESATGLSAGTHEISGTVTIEGKTINGTVTVDVLPMTFEVADFSSNATVNLPVDVTGDFYVEFDMEATNLDNLWIYISKDDARWGSGQIGLGWDADGNGGFKAQPQGNTVISTFVTNRTYRFLVHGNVDTDTYDLVVYDTVTKEVVATVDDYGFRTASDAINTIFLSSNGEGGVGTLSNIKVYAPDQADQFTSYTYVVTGAGSNNGTFTTTATSAEGVVIPYFEGYILADRSISGTTVTYTYEAQEDSLGSWAIRNNVVSGDYLTQMKYLGAHNAFANTDTLFENEGGSLYGTYGADNTGSSARNLSRTQTLSAIDQLNAGVRYFDIRLSRQEDGSFVTVHGPAFNYFRPIAYTIAQWAKENPGEVILLDFQTMVDALYTEDLVSEYWSDSTNYLYGNKAGDDNKFAYDALVDLLEEAGIMDFVYYTNKDGWDTTYGNITNNGTRTAIVLIGKARLKNCDSRFVCRKCDNCSYTSHETTYTESDDYDTIVSKIEAGYSNLSSGPVFGYIHAYSTTALSFSSLLGSSNILNDAASNNPNWCNETNFEAWMGRNNGDVLMMNGITEAVAATYLKYLDEYNRDGFNDVVGNETETGDGYTVNGVTLTGNGSSIPYSTEYTVDATTSEQTITVDGVEYTTKTVYDIAFMQYDADEVALNGDVTYTFPQVSDGATTVDVLFYNDAVVATGKLGEAISYTTSNTGNFVLATRVAPTVTFTVNYAIDGTVVYTDGPRDYIIGQPAYDFAASTSENGAYVTFGGKAYIVTNEAQSYTVLSTDDGNSKTVNFTLVHDNAVLGDTFANADGSADCNNTKNMLFVGVVGDNQLPETDADGSATSSSRPVVGGARIPMLEFNVPEDYVDGKAVKLYVHVEYLNKNIGGGGWVKLAANVTDTSVDETLGYKAADILNMDGVVWANETVTGTNNDTDMYDANKTIWFDVTEFVAAAKTANKETITFTLYGPAAGAYIVDREKAVAGSAHEGDAAYLEVVEPSTIEVTGASKITMNGNLVDSTTEVQACDGATIKLYETSAETPAFTDWTTVYGTDENTGETAYITVNGDANYVAAVTGLEPIDGAQVRIGEGVNADGKVSSSSGLRFITTLNTVDTLASIDGAEYGVEITAEGSEADPVVIPAAQWQEAGKVYTSALTKLAVSNYNRKFTATPYMTIQGQTFYGTSVTRSIYQVAAGLLANDTDGTTYDETALSAKRMIEVLNAYVNQTGIRLTFADSKLAARTEGSGAYSGNAFFTVGNTTVDGTKYTVTLTPVGDNTVINTNYWNTYVRINNNNSQTAVATTLTDNGDGTYTLTFDTSAVVSN